MSTRTVTYTITRPVTGVPWPNARLSWQLIPGSFDGEASFPNFRADSSTDADGEGSIDLWANEEGSIASVYRVTLPSGETADFTLPAGDDPIDLTVLRALGVINADWTDELLSTAILNNPDIFPGEGAPLQVFGVGPDGKGFYEPEVLDLMREEDGTALWATVGALSDALEGIPFIPDPSAEPDGRIIVFEDGGFVFGDQTGGGGGGAVDSVNGQTGVVVLDASDVGAAATNQAVTSFGVGTLADGEFLKRVGAALVGATPTGSGDMLASMYDPQAIEDDAFDLGTHTGDLAQSRITGLVSDLAAKAPASDLTAHIDDAADAHAATAISNTPAGTIAATTVQAAINELDTDSRMSDSRAPNGAAGGVLSGTYPNPGFAADMATQAELDAHTGDTSAAHAASAIANTPAGGIAATDVQAALNELDTEKATATSVSDHISDASAAHAATAISFTPAGSVAATDVQAAIAEVDGDMTTHAALTAAHGATGAVMGTTNAQTVTGKRNQPRAVQSAASGDITPDLSVSSHWKRTGLTAGITINAPTGTPVEPEVVVIEIKDNGTSRALTWNSAYKAFGAALPSATTVNKRLEVTARYNGTDWTTLTATEV